MVCFMNEQVTNHILNCRRFFLLLNNINYKDTGGMRELWVEINFEASEFFLY
jgi:hypothetical protein